MSEDFNPFDYKPTKIEVDKILPMQLPQEAVDKLLEQIDQDIKQAGTLKEILSVLGVAGKFAVKLGVEAAASSLADGDLGDLGGLAGFLGK